MADQSSLATPQEGSDAILAPFQVVRDVLAADDNVPRFLAEVPAATDFRNLPYDGRAFATHLLRSFMEHTAPAGTATWRIHAYPAPVAFGRDDARTLYQSRGFHVADMVITYSGGVDFGVCPITRQASLQGMLGGSSATYPFTGERFYAASGVSFTSRINSLVIDKLNDTVPSAVNEVQTLTIAASSGQFKLVFKGQTSADIAYNANAATIETAFEALSTVGADNGTIASTGPFTITFTEDLAAQEQPLVTVVPGTTPYAGGTITVARTTAGISPELMVRLDGFKNRVFWFEPLAMSGTRVLLAAAPWQK